MSFHEDLRGLDLHAPSNERVENQTYQSIPKLKAVALAGMGDSYPKVVPANPENYPNFAISAEEIAPGKSGIVTALGFMWSVDTSPWPATTILYSDDSGNLDTQPYGVPIAFVVRQDATCGVLYVFAIGDSTLINNWSVLGNVGTDPEGNFVGTQDRVGLSIRTDYQHRIRIDEKGNIGFGKEEPSGFFHIKEHTTSPGSGRIYHTFEVNTYDAEYNTAFAYTIPDNAIVKMEIDIIGREANDSFCSFKRTNTYSIISGYALRSGPGQSDYTHRTDPGFNFRFTQSGNQAIIQVKANTSEVTKWIGTATIDILTA